MAVDATANQTLPVGSMFALGWLMAQLFGPLQHRRVNDTSAHLPTVSELGADSYMDIAFLELEKLLTSLPGGLSDADIKAAWNIPDHEKFTAAVKALHLQILHQLVDNHPQLSAYQLGRALSDTCWLPDEKAGGEFVLREFGRYRLATLQTWLSEAGGALPPQSAATLSRSLQNWQDWTDINASEIKDGWATAHTSVVAALRTQASVWYALLAGETDLSGQTSIDAWVHAGQSIVRSARLLMLTIIRRFWPVVLVIAAATGGLLYLATANSSGTAKVWTSLVTVAAALGVSGASLRAAALKAVGGIEQDIRDAAALDARAWSVTWLPSMPQSPMQRYRLASRGVAAPQVKKGLPEPAEPAPPAPPILPASGQTSPEAPELAARLSPAHSDGAARHGPTAARTIGCDECGGSGPSDNMTEPAHLAKETMMRLTLHTFLSLDGVMQAPGGPDEDPGGGFAHGGWSFPYGDPDFGAAMTGWFAHADAFLLGRMTYQIFRGHWPHVTDADDPIASKLNALPKYVASTTLASVDWHNSYLLGGDVAAEVAKLKQQPGNELQVHGSGALAQTLIDHDLIDEYRLLFFPVHLGSGKKLFRDGTRAAALRLTGATTTSTGVIIATYEPAGPVRHGSYAIDEP